MTSMYIQFLYHHVKSPEISYANSIEFPSYRNDFFLNIAKIIAAVFR